MADINKVYVDANAFIDLAKFKANLALDSDSLSRDSREADVWRLLRLLHASREGAIEVYTSLYTIIECNHLKDSTKPVPDFETQRFFSELLSSGKSGVRLIQPTFIISEKARDLRWKHEIFLKPADALHAATALHKGCRELLTRDGDFHRNKLKLAALRLTVAYPSESLCLPEKYAQSDLFDEKGD